MVAETHALVETRTAGHGLRVLMAASSVPPDRTALANRRDYFRGDKAALMIRA